VRLRGRGVGGGGGGGAAGPGGAGGAAVGGGVWGPSPGPPTSDDDIVRLRRPRSLHGRHGGAAGRARVLYPGTPARSAGDAEERKGTGARARHVSGAAARQVTDGVGGDAAEPRPAGAGGGGVASGLAGLGLGRGAPTHSRGRRVSRRR